MGTDSRDRERVPLVGPLFAWELLRLARRGQTVRARALLLVVLLATYAVFGLVWFWRQPIRDWLFGGATLDIRDSAMFADTFVLTILLAQLAVVAILAPAYGAGVIAEEKERRSLGSLLTTRLTEREVVLGKFLGRVVLLVSLLVAGLPMFMLVQLSGGVDVVFVLAGLAITATTGALLAAVGMLVGATAQNVRTALYRAYGFTALFVTGGCVGAAVSPHGFVLLLYGLRSQGMPYETATALYAGLQLLVTALLVWMTVREVRWLRTGSRSGKIEKPRKKPFRRGRLRPKAVRRLDPDRADVQYAAPRAYRPRIPFDDPLGWKEKYVAGFVVSREEKEYGKAKTFGLVTAGGVVVVTFFLGLILYSARVGSSVGPIGAWVLGGMVAAGAWLLGVATTAAASICRERQRRTLESLLSLPVDRGVILWAKCRAAASAGRLAAVFGVLMGMLAFGPVYAAADGPVAFGTGAALLIFPLAGFVCVLGAALWLSGRCATTSRAMTLLMPLLAGVVVGPWVWWEAVESAEAFAGGLLLASAALASVGVWLYHRAVRELTGGVP
jgi:ABC-type transport system involved in multi-copper enzyme maturation permease subunit